MMSEASYFVSYLVQIIVAVGGGGLIASLITARQTKRKIANDATKSGADAASILSSSAIGLLEPMNQQIRHLEGRLSSVTSELTRVEEELRATKIENDSLRNEIRELMQEIRQYERRRGGDFHR